MQPDHVRVVLRLRPSWEAVDLGFRMIRTWWLTLMAAWLSLFVPFLAVILLLSPWPVLDVFLIWWLKPVLDRIVLHVLAQGVFGPVPRWADTLSSLPRLIIGTGLLLSLLPLRLSPQRSLMQPVLQLELLRGRAYSRRARLLSGRDTSAAIIFTLLCMGFEVALFLGVSSLLVTEMREVRRLEDAFQQLLALPSSSVQIVLVYAAVVTLIEPFYVGGGFGLYLNRRIELEGWDIEVVFRAIARRAVSGAGAAAAVLCLVLGLAGVARAQSSVECPRHEPAAVRECLERVLASDEFDVVRQRSTWQERDWLRELFENDDEEETPEPGSSAFANIAMVLAETLRIVVWVVGIIGTLVLLGRLARVWRPVSDAPIEAAAVREGARLLPETLPDDIIGAALARWAQDPTGALALLYAGARKHLVDRLDVKFPEGATEQECERLARRKAAVASDDFSALTRAWVFCAYAHRLPSAESFHELCERWRARLSGA